MTPNYTKKPIDADISQNLCRISVVFFGVIQTWVSRHSVNSDAVSYLDIGDAYFRGDWNAAINSMWSPLYAWLLGAANFVFQPSIAWEYPLAHLVNFGLYLAAFFGFEFFLREIMLEREQLRQNSIESDSSIIFSDAIFKLTGYFIFIWATLVLIKIKHIVPDLAVAAIVFLVAGLLLRLRKSENLFSFCLFGATLGIGYLAKAPMLPIGLIFLGCLIFLTRNNPKFRLQTAATVISLMIFALPFIVALSWSKNKLTFSENGKINYAWHVNGVSKFHWQGENEGAGKPLHPTRKIFDKPAIYEFGTPLNATYPVWYDPSYWYEGIELQFNLKKQLRKVFGQLIIEFLPIFSFSGVFLPVAFLVLFFFAADKCDFLKDLFRFWFLLLPSLAAIFMYLLIHVETRYVAPFATLILIGLIIGIETVKFKRKDLASAVLFIALIISVFPITFNTLQSNIFDFAIGKNTGDSLEKAAMQAKLLGIKPDDKIASIGRANDYTAKFARLTKTRIVAEIYDAEDVEYFWQADEKQQAEVMAKFAASGAKFLLTKGISATADKTEWQQLAETDFYYYRLPAVSADE